VAWQTMPEHRKQLRCDVDTRGSGTSRSVTVRPCKRSLVFRNCTLRDAFSWAHLRLCISPIIGTRLGWAAEAHLRIDDCDRPSRLSPACNNCSLTVHCTNKRSRGDGLSNH